jgi:hypothetical protein
MQQQTASQGQSASGSGGSSGGGAPQPAVGSLRTRDRKPHKPTKGICIELELQHIEECWTWLDQRRCFKCVLVDQQSVSHWLWAALALRSSTRRGGR